MGPRMTPATPADLPLSRLSLRMEHLLRWLSGAMARHWPLLVALVYLDCLAGILLGRGPYALGQILWHLAAIAFSLLLAALDAWQEAPSAQARTPTPIPRGVAIRLLALAALAGVLAAACLHRVPHPLPLDGLLRGLVGTGCLVLSLALCTRPGGPRQTHPSPSTEGSPP